MTKEQYLKDNCRKDVCTVAGRKDRVAVKSRHSTPSNMIVSKGAFSKLASRDVSLMPSE